MDRPSSLHEDFVRVKSLNDLERIQVENLVFWEFWKYWTTNEAMYYITK